MSTGRERGSDRLATATREITPEERVKASRVALRYARDRQDLRLLLDALGLNQQPSKENS